MAATTTIPVKAGRSSSKTAGAALWVVQALLAAMFFMAGGSKLAGVEKMVGLFQLLGLGQWFRYLTGGLEVVGAVLLLVPGLSGAGALLLVPVMIGAVITHLAVLGNSPAMPAVLLVGLLVVAWGRRESIALLARRARG